MVSKTFYRQFKRQQTGFLLLEAAIAIGFAAAALSIYTSILQKQIDMAKRARDLDMIEILVNQDINALRHQARLWKLNIPYASTGYNDYSVMTYDISTRCQSWLLKGNLESSYRTDLGSYNAVPGANRLTPASGDTNFQVQGYTINRTSSAPVNITDVKNANYVPPESSAQTLRINYKVTQSSSTPKTIPIILLERNVDIQIPIQFSC